MKNNVLCTLAADISAGAASLTVTPINATAFVIPPGATDATGATTGGTPTFGEPTITAMIIDRLDASQAKMEIVKLGVYTAPSGVHTFAITQRGAEGSTAQAWTAGALIVTPPTAELFSLLASGYAARTQAMLIHSQAGLMSWDGTTFKYSNFRALGHGRGKHASSVGWINIGMPANGTVAAGVGGAADVTAASGGWPLLSATTLYYEPNLAGDLSATTAGNFRVVGYATDYIVPPHWIMVATYPDNNTTDKSLRIGNGATLTPWTVVSGGIGFTNSWVDFGAPYLSARYQKDPEGWVSLAGGVKTGAIGNACFTLPAGMRPASTVRFPVESNGAYGAVEITNGGTVKPTVGSSTLVNLDGIRFLAGA